MSRPLCSLCLQSRFCRLSLAKTCVGLCAQHTQISALCSACLVLQCMGVSCLCADMHAHAQDEVHCIRHAAHKPAEHACMPLTCSVRTPLLRSHVDWPSGRHTCSMLSRHGMQAPVSLDTGPAQAALHLYLYGACHSLCCVTSARERGALVCATPPPGSTPQVPAVARSLTALTRPGAVQVQRGSRVHGGGPDAPGGRGRGGRVCVHARSRVRLPHMRAPRDAVRRHGLHDRSPPLPVRPLCRRDRAQGAGARPATALAPRVPPPQRREPPRPRLPPWCVLPPPPPARLPALLA